MNKIKIVAITMPKISKVLGTTIITEHSYSEKQGGNKNFFGGKYYVKSGICAK